MAKTKMTKQKMEKQENKYVEQELSNLMAKTLALEDELNALVLQQAN